MGNNIVGVPIFLLNNVHYFKMAFELFNSQRLNLFIFSIILGILAIIFQSIGYLILLKPIKQTFFLNEKYAKKLSYIFNYIAYVLFCIFIPPFGIGLGYFLFK